MSTAPRIALLPLLLLIAGTQGCGSEDPVPEVTAHYVVVYSVADPDADVEDGIGHAIAGRIDPGAGSGLRVVELPGAVEFRIPIDDDVEAARDTLERVLATMGGGGELAFRIVAAPGDVDPAELTELRRRLEAEGPTPEGDRSWYALEPSAESLAGTAGVVAGRHGETIYLLCHDRPGFALAHGPGHPAWRVADVSATNETGTGWPAIAVRLDSAGAARMERLSERHVGRVMAILLDDRVLTAPRIQTTLGGEFLIQGGPEGFDAEERRGLIRAIELGMRTAPFEPDPTVLVRVDRGRNWPPGTSGASVSFDLVEGAAPTMAEVRSRIADTPLAGAHLTAYLDPGDLRTTSLSIDAADIAPEALSREIVSAFGDVMVPGSLSLSAVEARRAGD